MIYDALEVSVADKISAFDTVRHHIVVEDIGHGGNALRMSALVMNMGDHVRASFEDNPYYRPGQLATRHAQLIGQLVRLARESGHEPTPPDEARQILGLTR